jgi:hypothetical protein
MPRASSNERKGFQGLPDADFSAPVGVEAVS